MTKLLLEKGANVEAQTFLDGPSTHPDEPGFGGHRALGIAAGQADFEIVRILIAYNADPNATDISGEFRARAGQ